MICKMCSCGLRIEAETETELDAMKQCVSCQNKQSKETTKPKTNLLTLLDQHEWEETDEGEFQKEGYMLIAHVASDNTFILYNAQWEKRNINPDDISATIENPAQFFN